MGRAGVLWGGQRRGPEQAQAWEVEGGTEGAGALPHSGIPTLGLGCFPPRPPVLFPLLQQRGKGGCNLGEWGSPCPPPHPMVTAAALVVPPWEEAAPALASGSGCDFPEVSGARWGCA